MYAVATQLDIMYVMSKVSRCMESPKKFHRQEVKRIIVNLKETCEFGTLYQRIEEKV